MRTTQGARSRRRFLEGLTAALPAVAAVRAPARAAQFEFRCGSTIPGDHQATPRQTQMWDAIERETGGRVRTQFFGASALGSESSMFAQLRSGALHFQLCAPGVVASVVPVADVSFLGFAYKDADEALRAMDGPLGAYLRAEIAAKGIYAMRTMWDNGMVQIGIGAGSHAIRTPEDLRGFKVRVLESRIAVELFKDLGAIPTPISIGQVYTAMQTKLVDGSASPLASIEAGHFYEVEKYISLTNHSWSGEWMLANADAWKSIPPDLQAVIERNATKYGLLERRDTRAIDASVVAQLTRQGVAINPVDQAPFGARLGSYYQEWAGAFGSTAWGLLESALRRKLV